MTFALPGFDLDAFVAATLAEDLGWVGDITSEAVIPADAVFAGVMDSRDAIVVAGLPIAEAFFRVLDSEVAIERLAGDGDSVPAGTVGSRATRRSGGALEKLPPSPLAPAEPLAPPAPAPPAPPTPGEAESSLSVARAASSAV